MKISRLLFLFCIVLLTNEVLSQNIAITDDDGYLADSSAMLDVKSVTKGVLIPRMTTLQRNSIANPATGLLVFDNTLGSFFFFNGSAWMNLSLNEEVWTKSGNAVFTTINSDKVGVGTNAPVGKLEVKADGSIGPEEPIFEVLNASGDTVFAVYQKGVRIFVDDNGPAKATGSRGGFAVGGFSDVKGITNEYLRVTPDSVRIYIDKAGGQKAVGNRGGFAVGGFSAVKSVPTDYFNISGADSAEVISPAEPRILWYPTKEAFLCGKVLIESVDSVGTNSIATGNMSKAVGDYSQAFGDNARAFGLNSTAIGYFANSSGDNSYSLGNLAYSADTGSYAIGTGAMALGLRSFAVGSQGIDIFNFNSGPTKAIGDYSYAFGMGSVTSSQGAFAFGTQDTASGPYSTAIGYKTKSTGQFSTALGSQSVASGDGAIAFGDMANANGQSAIAMGTNTISSGYASFAAGNNTQALSQYDVALGSNTIASGGGSFAIGDLCRATGTMSVAMGYDTRAENFGAFASGVSTKAQGYASTAIGESIIASADRTFGIGLDNPFPLTWEITQTNTMAIMGGSVGIGTVAPDAMLHVAGDARIEGDLYYGTGFSIYNKPDFVFKKNYSKQYDILDVEKFIKKNNHLPWVTSASDEKEGVNFTRMGFETLEAVENLQLQIIELKKESLEKDKAIRELTKQMEELNKKVESLKK